MNQHHTSAKDQIEFGLDSVDPERAVQISLKDLLYIHQTLGEFIRFFHNPEHYPDLEAIKRFLGDRSAGALFECYYAKLGGVIPEDVSEDFDNGAFDNPYPPYVMCLPMET